LVFASIDQPLIFAFYARKNTLTPALVGVWTTLLYALMALLPWWLGVLTLPLLILVNSIKLAAHALTMLVLTRRKMGGLGGHGIWRLVVKATVASAVMGGAVHVAAGKLAYIAPAGLVGEVLLVGGAGFIGAIIYGALAALLRMEEVGLARQAVLEWRRRLTRDGR